jgi:predicted nuclease of predicted toxin-antitoxin system
VVTRTIRFHLDENCDRAIAEGLRRRGIDVSTTPEVGLLSATDEEQIAFAVLQNRVLFTQDRDFLRLHGAATAHPGIAYCGKDTKSIGAIIQGLVLIWEVLEPEEMANRVEFL